MAGCVATDKTRDQATKNIYQAIELIDWGKQEELPARDLIRELIEWFIGDVLDELGTRKEVEYAFKILDDGTSADRQLRVYKETGSLEAVVDNLIQETEEGVW